MRRSRRASPPAQACIERSSPPARRATASTGASPPTCGTHCHSARVLFRDARRAFNHGQTRFVLSGAHRAVGCEKCHVGAVSRKLPFDRYSAATPPRTAGASPAIAGHQETSFRDAKFDLASHSAFPLAGRHADPACRKCHTSLSVDDASLGRKVADFKGLSTGCDAYHKDHHKGEFGRLWEACHVPAMTLKASGFVPPRSTEFFAGRHAGVACARCHADVHLGQVGTARDRRHAVESALRTTRFSHEAGAFRLTGGHHAAECAKCHASETAALPAGAGTARRLSPVSRECRGNHKDPHLGQVDAACATCHSTATFKVPAYAHRVQEAVFRLGPHDRLPCSSCHKVKTAQFPAGRGTALRLKVGRTCLDCHRK